MESIIFAVDGREDLVDSILSEPAFQEIKIGRASCRERV